MKRANIRWVNYMLLCCASLCSFAAISDLSKEQPEIFNNVLIQLSQSLPSTYPVIAPQTPPTTPPQVLPPTPPVTYNFFATNKLSLVPQGGTPVSLPAVPAFTWNMTVISQ